MTELILYSVLRSINTEAIKKPSNFQFMTFSTIKFTLLAALTLITFHSSAQNYASNIATDIEIDIQTTDFNSSRKK